jgi:hypothetical protein
MTHLQLHDLLELIRVPTLDSAKGQLIRESTAMLIANTPNIVNELLGALANLLDTGANSLAVQHALETIATAFNIRLHGNISPDVIEQLDQRLPVDHSSRQHLLKLLARCPTPENAQRLAELLVTRPLSSVESWAVYFASLIQLPQVPYGSLFPRLLDATQHAQAAVAVLDFTNFLVRSGRLAEHPGKSRAGKWIDLLGHLAGRLGQSEEWIRRNSSPTRGMAKQVTDSIELAVALCHTFGLLKERAAIGKLYQVLELSHRRLRIEAAAALAALGEDAGKEWLVELAAEPTVRLRALAYASELGMLDDVAPAHRSAEARAEAEFIVYLSDRTQFGFPPAQWELHDQRELYWPGYDHAVACFLFRYRYELPGGLRESIGIVGPLTHSFSADLSHLSIADIYAAFAGWQAEHDDIRIFDIDTSGTTQSAEIQRFLRRLNDAGFSEVEALFLGSFFGERSLIARAVRAQSPGIVIADAATESWFPDQRGNAPAQWPPELCFDIYKGRRMLAEFNPGHDKIE